MQPAAPPENEQERQAWLDKLNILDTLEEQAYDDLTTLAAHICGTPIALVSLIDKDRQWFKSHHGLEARETPRDVAFCAHAIHDNQLFMVENALEDPRFHDNPLATGEPHVEFYAGAPLTLRDGIRVGTLCVIDNHPRTLTKEQKHALMCLSRQVVSQLELRLKLQELQELDKTKDDFISNVSHELRTPITAISGALKLLQQSDMHKLNDVNKDLVDISIRNSDRLTRLVNDILDMARIASGRFTLELKSINAMQTLIDTIELNTPYCKKCSVQTKIKKLTGKDLSINADEKRIQQVLSNLISNASKFTNSGDTLELCLAEDEFNNFAVFSVTDHGPGIPAEETPNLFNRFHQIGENKNNKVAGTGLGLNICKQIVELHDGRLWVESEPNVKTTFYFSVPLAK